MQLEIFVFDCTGRFLPVGPTMVCYLTRVIWTIILTVKYINEVKKVLKEKPFIFKNFPLIFIIIG